MCTCGKFFSLGKAHFGQLDNSQPLKLLTDEEVEDARSGHAQARHAISSQTEIRAAIRRCGRRVAAQRPKTTQSRFAVVAKSGSRQSTTELDSEQIVLVALFLECSSVLKSVWTFKSALS